MSAGDVEWVGVGGPAYDFTEQQDILSSDKEETTVDIGIEILGEETFDCILEHEVSWSCQRLRKALVAKHPFIPNWSQLLKTPISFLPSRSDTMSFSVDQSSQSCPCGSIRLMRQGRACSLSVKSSSCAAVVNICGGN